jgi:hypothetical protein
MRIPLGIATVVDGLLAGASVDQSVEQPAERRITAEATLASVFHRFETPSAAVSQRLAVRRLGIRVHARWSQAAYSSYHAGRDSRDTPSARRAPGVRQA